MWNSTVIHTQNKPSIWNNLWFHHHKLTSWQDACGDCGKSDEMLNKQPNPNKVQDQTECFTDVNMDRPNRPSPHFNLFCCSEAHNNRGCRVSHHDEWATIVETSVESDEANIGAFLQICRFASFIAHHGQIVMAPVWSNKSRSINAKCGMMNSSCHFFHTKIHSSIGARWWCKHGGAKLLLFLNSVSHQLKTKLQQWRFVNNFILWDGTKKKSQFLCMQNAQNDSWCIDVNVDWQLSFHHWSLAAWRDTTMSLPVIIHESQS